jgi:hypothetical protein
MTLRFTPHWKDPNVVFVYRADEQIGALVRRTTGWCFRADRVWIDPGEMATLLTELELQNQLEKETRKMLPFQFEGIDYLVPNGVTASGIIQLPDGRQLRVDNWIDQPGLKIASVSLTANHPRSEKARLASE